ncbi:MAG: hypothetical protein WA347_07745 [Rhabdochlamydiaceae bacterium]|jgi:2'-5' RNA ligase
MRYILALIPSKQHILTYIQAAQQSFAPINDGYLLADNKSIPHVTICSFQCDEHKVAEIWSHVESWQINNCPIRAIGLMLKKGKAPQYHYSVGLSVARDSQLLHLHYLASDLLESHGITSLNPSRELYQPHLTLAGIGWLPAKDIVLPFIIDDLLSLPSYHFHIVLGRGDDIGQYLETLFEL